MEVATMPKMILSAINLQTLSDGFGEKTLERALNILIQDILNRGHDGQKRTLSIKLVLEPHADGSVAVDILADPKTPPWKPPTTMAKIDRAAGGLVFNTDARPNPDQRTIHELIPADDKDGAKSE